jgi:prepilin-type N-terminal cleavage/methylation domain-containing protein
MMMRMMRRRRPFTLIEVMIVMAILVLIGGLFGVRGKHLVDYYAFSSSIDKIASRCRLARNLAVNYQTDVAVHVVKRNKEITVTLVSDEPPLKKLPQFISSLHTEGVSAMLFEDKELEEFEVLFSGSGGIFPEGTLTLSSKEKTKEIFFLLSQP